MDRLYVIGQIRRTLDTLDDRELNKVYRWLSQYANKPRTSGGTSYGSR